MGDRAGVSGQRRANADGPARGVTAEQLKRQNSNLKKRDVCCFCLLPFLECCVLSFELSMHRRRFLVAILLICASVAVTRAALPTFWQVSTEADFLRGDVENLAIDSFGRLMLGPTSTPVYDTSAPFLWTVVTGPDGSIYAGSGNEGIVYRIDPSGRGSAFFDAEELEAHALALAPGGGVYVGSSPDG